MFNQMFEAIGQKIGLISLFTWSRCFSGVSNYDKTARRGKTVLIDTIFGRVKLFETFRIMMKWS